MPWPPLDRIPWATLRLRLTIWNTLVVLMMTVASLLAARVAARATLYAEADAQLRAAVREVVLAVRDLSPDIDAVVAEISRKAESHQQRGWFVQLLEEDGTTLWKSDLCPAEVAVFPPSNLDREENVVQVGPYRYVRLRIARADEPTYHVRVGTYTTGGDVHDDGPEQGRSLDHGPVRWNRHLQDQRQRHSLADDRMTPVALQG